METKRISTSDARWGQDFPEVVLPSDQDLAALEAMVRKGAEVSFDERVREAIGSGLLGELACFFDPAGQGIEQRKIPDLKILIARYMAVVQVLSSGDSENKVSPIPPRLHLRECRIEKCGNLTRAMSRIGFGVCFEGCHWIGPVNFVGISFSGMADFHHSEFYCEAKFYLSKFDGGADFNGVKFYGDAEFCGSEFQNNVSFFVTLFHGCANFSGTRFLGTNEFLQTTFNGPTDFSDADFAQPLDLRRIERSDNHTWNFYNLKFNGSKILTGHLHIGSDSLFHWKWFLFGWSGSIQGDSNCPISFLAFRRTIKQLSRGTDRWKDFFSHYRRHYHQAREDMLAACEQYGMLEANLGAQPYADSWEARDWCHYRYLDLRRRTRRRLYNPLRWANWLFLKWCFGYGAYPKHVLAAGLVTMVLFALMYTFWFADFLWTTAPPLGPHNLAAETDLLTRFGNALYFSVITFATIGYGDWHPVHYAKPVAAVEGLMGIFIMSVFTVSFARKILR